MGIWSCQCCDKLIKGNTFVTYCLDCYGRIMREIGEEQAEETSGLLSPEQIYHELESLVGKCFDIKVWSPYDIYSGKTQIGLTADKTRELRLPSYEEDKYTVTFNYQEDPVDALNRCYRSLKSEIEKTKKKYCSECGQEVKK